MKSAVDQQQSTKSKRGEVKENVLPYINRQACDRRKGGLGMQPAPLVRSRGGPVSLALAERGLLRVARAAAAAVLAHVHGSGDVRVVSRKDRMGYRTGGRDRGERAQELRAAGEGWGFHLYS